VIYTFGFFLVSAYSKNTSCLGGYQTVSEKQSHMGPPKKISPEEPELLLEISVLGSFHSR